MHKQHTNLSMYLQGSLMKILADQENLDLQDEIQDCFKSIITDWNNVTLGSNIEMVNYCFKNFGC